MLVLPHLPDMDISEGFQIEEPDVFVPWSASESELSDLLGSHLRHVTDGYYTLSCRSLSGMAHELGFHFKPRRNGKLNELEFFRRSYADQASSYEQFQRHFEQAFGSPDRTEAGTEGFASHEWRCPGAVIRHYVFDRFGPEEHMRISRR
ncbi:MAG: hypothetical protein AAF089_00800 [Bacteroidota bacterium]